MKTALKITLFFFALGVIIISSTSVHAQCAQCAATVASNSASGDKTANGLNAGILFLLAMPYLVVAVGGYVWYKSYRRKNVNIQMHNEKLHLN